MHKTLFENKANQLKGESLEVTSTDNIRKYYAFHLDEISCFNKGKINKGLEFGRAYKLTRIEGNFLIVGECNSIRMPDSGSLPQLIYEHQELFGKQTLKSIATDKGYFSQNNEMMLKEAGIEEIGLQRPDRVLNCPRSTLSLEAKERLHNRRAGIEAMISHAKHCGQLGRSRMKSDCTILASGYSSILGLNLRQLMRYLMAKPPPNSKIVENNKFYELIAVP